MIKTKEVKLKIYKFITSFCKISVYFEQGRKRNKIFFYEHLLQIGYNIKKILHFEEQKKK